MKKVSFKKRFNYWLDKEMSKGTISIIRLMSVVVLSIVVFVSVLIFLFKLKDSFFSAFWDSLASTINAYMPNVEEDRLGYVVLNTVTAIVGLLFTSVLIGVISSGIEERISDLRKGNSIVLEEGHTVILGYNSGEHGLLKQLILSTGREKRCIVIFTDIEKPDMEADISNNIDIPKNITVLCRNGDITNINDLRCCSIETAGTVIINAMNDNRRVKAILAVSALTKDCEDYHAKLYACVTNDKYLLPSKKLSDKKITLLKTDDIMARIIAHSSTEPGLSLAFKELLNFENNEFYFETDKRLVGKSVLEISGSMDHGGLAGIKHNNRIILNPDRDMIVSEGDEIIVFEEEKGTYILRKQIDKNVEDRLPPKFKKEPKGKVGVFGYNSLLNVILDEIHNDVKDICIISDKEEAKDLAGEYPGCNIEIYDGPYEKKLETFASEFKHILLLVDREKDREDGDVDVILLLLKLLDIKERNNYDYNLVVELNMEGSYNVAPKNKEIDYIVNSNISSLILAQISENPDLERVFKELLTNRGNELYSKPISNFNLSDKHDYSIASLKEIVLSYRYTLLGVMTEKEVIMNPDLDRRISFDMEDRLIVLGKE